MKQASHLLKYDSTLGTFNADVKCGPPGTSISTAAHPKATAADTSPTCRVVNDNTITVNGKEIKIVSNRDPLQLPWGEMVRRRTA